MTFMDLIHAVSIVLDINTKVIEEIMAFVTFQVPVRAESFRANDIAYRII